MKKEIKIISNIKLRKFILPKMLEMAKVCSFNLLELREFLYHEIENNILLEKKERKRKETIKEREDFDIREFFQVFSESDYFEREFKGEEEEEGDFEAFIPAKGPSLYERLLYQIEFAFKGEERNIAIKLIDYINKEGFIKEEIKEIAKNLNVSESKVEKIRKKIMALDPLGVGARDVRESLLFQLEVRKLENTLAYKIIKNYFNELLISKEKLAEKLGKSIEEVNEALLLIRRLNFKPGLLYSEEGPQYVVPEYVIKFRDNELVFEEVSGFLPEIRLNQNYLKMLEDENVSSNVKKFIEGYAKRAREFLELLNERKRRIEKVINFIIDYQRDFLVNSEGRLKPVFQTEAAKKLGMPISTFHRIITGKYVSTPRGIFELRFFFPRGLRIKKGKVFDREEVKSIIKGLIENENPDFPLSDGEIRKILKFEKGIDITRREVCKLRREMGIESSERRKKK